MLPADRLLDLAQSEMEISALSVSDRSALGFALQEVSRGTYALSLHGSLWSERQVSAGRVLTWLPAHSPGPSF